MAPQKEKVGIAAAMALTGDMSACTLWTRLTEIRKETFDIFRRHMRITRIVGHVAAETG
jgi:hypothetical protein